jgi:hypothetical protein
MRWCIRALYLPRGPEYYLKLIGTLAVNTHLYVSIPPYLLWLFR